MRGNVGSWFGLRSRASIDRSIRDRAPGLAPVRLATAATGILAVGLASVLGTAPAAPRQRSSRPDAYPVSAQAQAERTLTSRSFSVTWIDDPSSPDAPSLRDRDGDGSPDAVESLLAAFESARAFLLGELGYRPPPVVGPYRIYVASRDGAPPVTKAVHGPGQSRPSFTIVPAHLLRPAEPRSLRVMAVHEFFHAIQIGYDAAYDHWIGESTATWVEDVFDDAGDPNHHVLPRFVPDPRRPLTDIGGEHEYGAFLFIQFLVERYGGGNPGIVRELWERIAETRDAIAAIEAVLARRQVPFGDAWAEFLLWRWDLDRFEEGEAYRRTLGPAWPSPLQATEVRNESCRLTSDVGLGLPALAGDYSVFRPAERPDQGKATVTIEGPPHAVGFALVQKLGGGEKYQLLRIGADGLGAARVKFGDRAVRRVVLGVGNAAKPDTGARASIAYSLRIIGRNGVTAEAIQPPSETSYFGGLSLRGRVLCEGQPQSLANVVLVQEKVTGERKTFPLQTLGGTWSVNIQPEATSTYRLEVVDPLLSPVVSPPWRVGVRVGLTLEAPDTEIQPGQPATVQGRVTPAHPGALVQIDYRRPDLGWLSGPQTAVEGDGSYRATVALPGPGIWQLRATVLDTGDEDHLGETTVNDVFVNVR